MKIEERFWTKVDKGAECWTWTAAHTADGYGLFRVSKEQRSMAHRFAYELVVGPIPDGLTLDHLCRVRDCVNPDHLEPVTRAENTRRGLLPVLSRNEDTCRSGLHPWPDSARNDTTRGLYCYECKLIANRRNGAAARRAKRLKAAGGVSVVADVHHAAPSVG